MFLRITNILTLVASILLLVALSAEIIYPRELATFSGTFTVATLVVCIIYCFDFFVLMANAKRPWRFLLRNFGVLLLSIPFHWIADKLGFKPNHTTEMVMSGLVMLRSVLAMYITLRWLISRRTTRLLWVYVATVLLCTYFASLLFYEYEAPVNPSVRGFSDALWWAGMNLTTVGAEIFPVTPLGKLICVLLPILGAAIFPVLTVYITSLYERHGAKSGIGVAEDRDKPKTD
ncbi:MAG: two pore domain potassium channel family protein [Alistipes sp.]|jgi:voltage-gated potassium channel|nr:two pore domain potassium channel family protein [Alistipes sp.]